MPWSIKAVLLTICLHLIRAETGYFPAMISGKLEKRITRHQPGQGKIQTDHHKDGKKIIKKALTGISHFLSFYSQPARTT